MTILSANNFTNDSSAFCNRLSFGVPLEDVFPQGDVHPSIKCLLLEIYTCYHQSTSEDAIQLLERQDVVKSYEIISTNLMQTLMFNQRFTTGFCFLELMAALRYFLQCLPLPLMPSYTNKQHFAWDKLSLECQESLEKRLNGKSFDQALLLKLSKDLLRLPKVNLLLIGHFINFLRSLIYCKGRKLNKSRVLILVDYFTPCVCTREYIPGKPQYFHHLMLYLILRWPEVQNHCVQNDPTCFSPQPQPLQITRRFTNSIISSTRTNLMNTSLNFERLDTIDETSESVNSDCAKLNISNSTSTIPGKKLMRNESTQTSNVHRLRKCVQTSTISIIETPKIQTETKYVQTDVLRNEAIEGETLRPEVVNQPVVQIKREASSINSQTSSKQLQRFREDEEVNESSVVEDSYVEIRECARLPSCENLNHFEFCDLENAPTEPLNPEVNSRKSFKDLLKFKRGFELFRKLKQPNLIRRAFSEDAVRAQIKYHKFVPTKKFFRTF